MIGLNRRAFSYALASLVLALCTYILSNRYYTSATLERPTHFVILTLSLSSVALAALRRCTNGRKTIGLLDEPSPTESRLPARYGGQHNSRLASAIGHCIDRARRVRPPFYSLLGCIIARAVLFWYITNTTQCTSSGLEAFLPFFTLVVDLVASHPSSSQIGSTAKARQSVGRSWSLIRTLLYAMFALGWAFAAMSALSHTRISTGTVCPVGWRSEPLTPLFQLFMCAIDAVILVRISRVRQVADEEGTDATSFIAVLLFVSASCVFTISLLRLPIDANYFWATNLYHLDIRDLMFDSVVASTAILSGLSLVTVLHTTTLAVLVTSVGLLGYLIPGIGSGLALPPLSTEDMAKTTAVAAICVAPLWLLAIYPHSSTMSTTTTVMHRWLLVCYFAVVALCTLRGLSHPSPAIALSLRSAVGTVISVARYDATQWVAQASTSKTLPAAVAEYKLRYGIPPPPNFDKWYAFAVKHKSPVIDDFRQIHDDLLPFWGIEPSVIRSRTKHLLQYTGVESGGLRIRAGVVEQSPHIPGTHRWMTDSLQKMIEPFSQWVPDMDLAINLADECQVAVPFERMQILKSQGSKARARLGKDEQKSKAKSKDNKSPWSKSFPEPLKDWSKTKPSPEFTRNVRRMIFYDSVAAACPPDSLARTSRWWDWSTACVECMIPHSYLTYDGGAIIVNATLANDLCHQPDIAYLDGFVMSPSAMVGTNTLFPIFSQGRVSGFSDILIPSPWNFDKKSVYQDRHDPHWKDKTNSVFWRGSSSDGYAAYGTWAGFVRARFGHEAYERARNQPPAPETPSKEPQPLGVDVSFTGTMARCHTADCRAEQDTFHQWSTAATGAEMDPETQLPPVTPFEEHWRFRHLVDMDGSGFSGRFVPFLQSRSLVYRAALFRAWFDERLAPWYHYVPVDVRLGRGFWAVLELMAGGDKDGQRAHEIATQGREWAQKALRPEDSQIYMFRLLLEWGRVVDDDREHLEYTPEPT